jgi:hypothetical protein
MVALIQTTPPTSRIEATVRATRASFTYRQQRQQHIDQRVSPLFNYVRAQRLTITSFSSMTIERGHVSTRERFRDTGWQRVDAQYPVEIAPTADAATATFHDVWIRTLIPPDTTQVEISAIERDGKAGISALLEGGRSSLVIAHTAGAAIELDCDNCALAGGSGRTYKPFSPSTTIRVEDQAERLFTIAGGNTRLAFDLVPVDAALRKEQFLAEDVRFCEKPRERAAIIQAAVSLTGGLERRINTPGSTLRSTTLRVLASNPLRLSDLKVEFDPAISSSPSWFDVKVDGTVRDVRLGESCEAPNANSIVPSRLAARRPWIWAVGSGSLVAFVAGLMALYRGRT